MKDGQSTKRIDWKNEVMPAIKERLDAFNSRGIIPTLRASETINCECCAGREDAKVPSEVLNKREA